MAGNVIITQSFCTLPFHPSMNIVVLMLLQLLYYQYLPKLDHIHSTIVCVLSPVQLCVTPWTQQARPPCTSPSPGVCPSSCPLNRSCYPTITSSATLFSFCLQSLPASGSFPMSGTGDFVSLKNMQNFPLKSFLTVKSLIILYNLHQLLL